MILKDYLIDFFYYNDSTNRELLSRIAELKDKEESIKLFSHLINSQYKWMARIKQDPAAKEMSWWEPAYNFENLADKWAVTLSLWIDFINSKTEEELLTEVTFTGFDGGMWAATAKDIALQLNYHSIHHRAQIQTILRAQGVEPDFVDYIGTKYRKLN